MGQSSDPAAHDSMQHRGAATELVPVPEVLETVLVSSAELPAPGERATVPAFGAAAVAAGSFLAGAAVAGVVSHRRRARAPVTRPRRLLRRRAGGAAGQSAAGDVLQIVASRSLLVDVHLLGIPGADR